MPGGCESIKAVVIPRPRKVFTRKDSTNFANLQQANEKPPRLSVTDEGRLIVKLLHKGSK